jgi:hypothetical protein
MRERMGSVVRISTSTRWIELHPGQCFYKTPRAWEIWEEAPALRRLERIPATSVFWVIEEREKA